jgi:hypothetical protein
VWRTENKTEQKQTAKLPFGQSFEAPTQKHLSSSIHDWQYIAKDSDENIGVAHQAQKR